MPSLSKIGSLLKVVDRLILQLASKRLFLARLVAFEKKKTDDPIFRSEIEDQRLGEAKSYAKEIGMNPNFAHMIMYSLINESCKQQMILLQDEKSVDLTIQSDDVRMDFFRKNLIELNSLISHNIEKFSNKATPTLDSYLDAEDRLLHKAASRVSPGVFVDIGTGLARSIRIMEQKFEKCIGYDISEDIVQQARHLCEVDNKNIEIHTHDLRCGIPLSAGSVDLLLAGSGTASEIPGLTSLLNEIDRVLAPGGKAVLSYFNSESIVANLEVIPWFNGLLMEYDKIANCINVNFEGRSFELFCEFTSQKAIESSLPHSLSICETITCPTLEPLFSIEFLEANELVEEIRKLDESIAASSNKGIYLTIVLEKAAKTLGV